MLIFTIDFNMFLLLIGIKIVFLKNKYKNVYTHTHSSDVCELENLGVGTIRPK